MFDKRTALLSDIHSNLSAFEAVLKDCREQGVEELYFLGDIVGYGPRPNECISLLRDACDLTKCILGNHDWAFLNNADYYGVYARLVVEWTQRVVTPENRVWVSGFSKSIDAGAYTLLHGSPREPTNEYLLHHDCEYHRSKIEACFDCVSGLCVNGHTHIPGSFIYDPETKSIEWAFPEDCGSKLIMDERKYILNIGSVGQPRDRNPRASYAIAHENSIQWRRVEYDIERTIQEIAEIPEIPELLGLRLRLGR